MPVINRIADFHDDMTAWRRELHTHPEIGFEEVWTSDFIAARLEEFGIEVDRGMAKTGVVGTLRNGEGPAIALRADMDALPLDEANDFGYRSQNPGRMHACGHDGHSTMLLGAARYLAETKRFKGTVHFVFQPAEESFAGGRKMVEDGLFKKFPVKGVYGMHNWPGLPFGQFGVISGPIMASADQFEITVRGRGVHAAMPHRGVDCVVVASQIVMALQTIASRTVDPIDSVVVSVGRFAAGDTFNILPDAAHLSGTVRTFSNAVRDTVEDTFRRIVDGVLRGPRHERRDRLSARLSADRQPRRRDRNRSRRGGQGGGRGQCAPRHPTGHGVGRFLLHDGGRSRLLRLGRRGRAMRGAAQSGL